MLAESLVDTGALLALLDRDDRWHHPCLEVLSRLRLPLVTTSAVLTELFHLTRPHEMAATWDFLRSGVVMVRRIDQQDLPDLERLMKRYADRPMDFADATLVHRARLDGLRTVFTVDHNDFETYRIEGKRRFRVVPARS